MSVVSTRSHCPFHLQTFFTLRSLLHLYNSVDLILLLCSTVFLFNKAPIAQYNNTCSCKICFVRFNRQKMLQGNIGFFFTKTEYPFTSINVKFFGPLIYLTVYNFQLNNNLNAFWKIFIPVKGIFGFITVNDLMSAHSPISAPL